MTPKGSGWILSSVSENFPQKGRFIRKEEGAERDSGQLTG